MVFFDIVMSRTLATLVTIVALSASATTAEAFIARPGEVCLSNPDHSYCHLKSKYHLVQPGDTLWGISKQYTGSGLNWKTIADDNHILNPTTDLHPGRYLEIK